jgi:hypothetical protein
MSRHEDSDRRSFATAVMLIFRIPLGSPRAFDEDLCEFVGVLYLFGGIRVVLNRQINSSGAVALSFRLRLESRSVQDHKWFMHALIMDPETTKLVKVPSKAESGECVCHRCSDIADSFVGHMTRAAVFSKKKSSRMFSAQFDEVGQVYDLSARDPLSNPFDQKSVGAEMACALKVKVKVAIVEKTAFENHKDIGLSCEKSKIATISTFSPIGQPMMGVVIQNEKSIPRDLPYHTSSLSFTHRVFLEESYMKPAQQLQQDHAANFFTNSASTFDNNRSIKYSKMVGGLGVSSFKDLSNKATEAKTALAKNNETLNATMGVSGSSDSVSRPSLRMTVGGGLALGAGSIGMITSRSAAAANKADKANKKISNSKSKKAKKDSNHVSQHGRTGSGALLFGLVGVL